MTKTINRIREVREAKGLSQRELAEVCGTYQQQIDRLEKGLRKFSIQWQVKIANALDVKIQDLVQEIEDKPVGDLLQNLRVEAGLQPKEIAKQLNLSLDEYTKFEEYKGKLPFDFAVKLTNIYSFEKSNEIFKYTDISMKNVCSYNLDAISSNSTDELINISLDKVDIGKTVESLGFSTKNKSVWVVNSHAISYTGLVEGYYIVVDEACVTPKSGDVVVANVINGNKPINKPILRVFNSPYLICDPKVDSPRLASGDEVSIKGVVIASWKRWY